MGLARGAGIVQTFAEGTSNNYSKKQELIEFIVYLNEKIFINSLRWFFARTFYPMVAYMAPMSPHFE